MDNSQNGIIINVDPSLGTARAGRIWIPVPAEGVPAELLAVEQDTQYAHGYRPVRAALCTREQFEADRNRNHPALTVQSPDWNGVATAARAIAAETAAYRAAEAAKEAEYAATRDAEIAAIAAEVVTPGPTEHLAYNPHTPWQAWSVERYIRLRGDAVDILRSECERRNRATESTWLASVSSLTDNELADLSENARANLPRDLAARAEAVREARKEAAESANMRAIEAALSTAPSHVLERWQAERLPKSELTEALANVAFAALDLPRYEKLQDSDVEHSDECDDQSDTRVRTTEYDGELDAEEWESWKTVKAAIEAAGFEAELRKAEIYCATCRESHTRLQARATTTIGGINVMRNYAIG